mmetsp:Transcript_1469/g.4440  ORF Transcript_1469/g.4440 Transcript_1469/m.4440 type:complete len:742 (+) Transcript_1469:250-2475(+)|eukprot:CAMPEP_0198734514 /NCGR_PEP_ID=MMETSP1475-20131203/53273_1 /TAXON_ID= ORGANISM="Unidentified sp., Strain CCMP1999" /NCGR_SAMPLE_ID=MMETSP1475 /ASSEMBLY_ACC=CAM_ASM_001111 /LENGTH=741 /DNA_ID=CAMNT_0044498005 /DNA_START=139 /DNA_END=2364 /DNA_ORIENTATION=-
MSDNGSEPDGGRREDEATGGRQAGAVENGVARMTLEEGVKAFWKSPESWATVKLTGSASHPTLNPAGQSSALRSSVLRNRTGPASPGRHVRASRTQGTDWPGLDEHLSREDAHPPEGVHSTTNGVGQPHPRDGLNREPYALPHASREAPNMYSPARHVQPTEVDKPDTYSSPYPAVSGLANYGAANTLGQQGPIRSKPGVSLYPAQVDARADTHISNSTAVYGAEYGKRFICSPRQGAQAENYATEQGTADGMRHDPHVSASGYLLPVYGDLPSAPPADFSVAGAQAASRPTGGSHGEGGHFTTFQTTEQGPKLGSPTSRKVEEISPPWQDGTRLQGRLDRLLVSGSDVQRLPRIFILNDSMLATYEVKDSLHAPIWEIDVNSCPVSAGAKSDELLIHLPIKTLTFVAPSPEERQKWLLAIEGARKKEIPPFYAFGKLLGSGAFADVYLATDIRTKQTVAIKQITKSKCGKRELEFLQREINILKSMRHPNIISVYDVYDTPSTFYIVLEFMEGGELFDVIAHAGSFSEKDASAIMRDMVKGVAFLHSHGIVHRDLKPENMLCSSKCCPPQVKIADFGLAGFVSDLHDPSLVGTLSYMAPEILNHEEYDGAVDMWSLGVILYVMLSGRMPFFGKTDDDCMEQIRAGRYWFPDKQWSSISNDAKSLIKQLLQLDPKIRLTAKATLNHRWLTGRNLTDTCIANKSSIHSSNKRRLRRAAFAVLCAAKLVRLLESGQYAGGGAD